MDQTVPSHENPQNLSQTNSHILVISCPLQGHVSPLLKFSHQITKLGAKVTFLTTEVAHARMSGRMVESDTWNRGLRMISIPDTLEHEGSGLNQEKLYVHLRRVMPGFLEDLLSRKMDQSSESHGDRISGVIVDSSFAWVMGILKRIGVKVALFWPCSAGCLALGLKISELVESKFIDDNGTPLKSEPIALLPNMPTMTVTDLLWYYPEDKNMQKGIFYLTKEIFDHIKEADWILCNFFHELEPMIHTLAPNILPIGPVQANGLSSGSLFSEDSTCVMWLNKFPKGSVIYAAFGTTSRFSQQQLDELASGLELTGRPFLWVTRLDQTLAPSPVGIKGPYIERVADRGKLVDWAPQAAVLAHPAIGCFISHCGWNSFMESMSMGVPLVCWPCFADQTYTRTCVCDAWSIGVRLLPNQGGVVSKFEIKRKVDEIMCDDGVLRKNGLRFKELSRMSISEGGSSLANLGYLIEQMKG